jgi:exopolyphosphatase/guanosine-5'-triphosphate,3'-diphosphate pyrophosphatase
LKFAAIDIGSNAIRLLLCNVYEDGGDGIFKKADLVRVPLRLGEDAFLRKKISEKKIEKLVSVMKSFKLLIDFYEVQGCKACATSALREAQNGSEIIDRIRREAGIKVDIIDGKTEAEIVYSNHVAEKLDKSSDYLYIDVGGGSTEITLFSKNKCIASRSFNIGTIRLLHGQVYKEQWKEFKDWVKETTDGYHPLTAIGSGGNINKLFKISRRKQNKPLSYTRLKQICDFIEAFSLEDRIKILGLNTDRADVIVPAAKIFMTIMKAAGIEKIIVPQIGMADGIIHLLYENYRQKKIERERAKVA